MAVRRPDDRQQGEKTAPSRIAVLPRSRLGVLWAYAAMRFKVRLAYRADFLFNAFGDVLSTSIGLVVVLTLFSHVSDVAGYSAAEVLLCWGMAEASLGLFWVLFQGLYAMNQQYVVRGELDRVLLRPVDPWLQVMLDHVNIEDLPVSVLGLSMFFAGTWQLGLSWSLAQVLLLPVFVLSGALLVGGLLTGLSAVGFWSTHRGTAIGLAYRATLFARYPLEVFPKWLQVLVFGLTPFSFAGFVPATFYMDRPDWHAWALAQPLVGLACFAAGLGFWRFSLRRYSSTGT